ncbi:hypothetical protein [Curtobacterium sp. MCSS17_015]|uniref:hypothetical protein n=1 Tax=Curtobacterium sp. MCSS17_015 TaxID=2175666 RepID=UPI000DA74D71|nr:hypothetical protein [Curtobacterium sp. MCSS17_015]WIB25429.1 hypothetical protein DEJ18_10205 [Curtobacterium sp. MCSS17_015]
MSDPTTPPTDEQTPEAIQAATEANSGPFAVERPATPYQEYRSEVPAALAKANEPAPVPAPVAVPSGPTPGKKPEFLVVENSLKCQTEEGEISLDLRLPIPQLEKFMTAQELEPMKIPRFVLDELLPEPTSQRLLSLADGAQAYKIVMRWAQEVGARLGASLGESPSSTDSSESTGQPSEPTSAPATA